MDAKPMAAIIVTYSGSGKFVTAHTMTPDGRSVCAKIRRIEYPTDVVENAAVIELCRQNRWRGDLLRTTLPDGKAVYVWTTCFDERDLKDWKKNDLNIEIELAAPYARDYVGKFRDGSIG